MTEYDVKITAIKSGKEGGYALVAVIVAILLEVQIRLHVPGFEGDVQNTTIVVMLSTFIVSSVKAVRNFVREKIL